jgi:hypothetical protein
MRSPASRLTGRHFRRPRPVTQMSGLMLCALLAATPPAGGLPPAAQPAAGTPLASNTATPHRARPGESPGTGDAARRRAVLSPQLGGGERRSEPVRRGRGQCRRTGGRHRRPARRSRTDLPEHAQPLDDDLGAGLRALAPLALHTDTTGTLPHMPSSAAPHRLPRLPRRPLRHRARSAPRVSPRSSCSAPRSSVSIRTSATSRPPGRRSASARCATPRRTATHARSSTPSGAWWPAWRTVTPRSSTRATTRTSACRCSGNGSTASSSSPG